jgi:two-component system sensor histidine kinase UhpB
MSTVDLPIGVSRQRVSQLRRGVRRLSLFNRILLSNAMIVVLGAVAGTWLTSLIVRRAPSEMIVPLAAGFAVIGTILSVLVNIVVLRAALSPLAQLRQAAQAVRSGDLTARASVSDRADVEMTDLAETLNATLDELARDHAQLRSLSSQVIRAQEEERRRIARELHDDTAQLLFAQLLRVTALKSSVNEELRRAGEDLEVATVEALEGVRRLALELRPPALDDLGLADALADLAQRFLAQTRIKIDYQERGSRSRLPGRRGAGPLPGRPGGADQRGEARPRLQSLDGPRSDSDRCLPLDPRRWPGV